MTKVEFLDWKEHPVTAEMYKAFMEVRDSIKEDLATGSTLGNESETARRVGMIEGLDFFLNAGYDGEDDES